MTVKLEDVAELAGVSKTTVSRVLNNRGYISEQTRKKVHEAMEELHYSPNAVARQLFKKETKLVGLIFPSVDNPFLGS
ncbi:LacI family DNA-binding transcriptional regulator [Pediococcus acidilactici]